MKFYLRGNFVHMLAALTAAAGGSKLKFRRKIGTVYVFSF